MVTPRITACICTYNRYDTLSKALQSVVDQSLDRSLYRIMVVDNSPDHARAEAFGAGLREPSFLDYRIETTPGLSNARNVGARDCGTEFIAFMDDDAIAKPRWLEQILLAFDTFGARVGVVGGRVDPLWESPRPAWLDDAMLGHVSVVNWGGGLREAGQKEWFAGTNIAFRAQAILDHGLFDVRLGRTGGGASLLSNEETELVRRIHEAGQIGVYQPDAIVDHLVERRRLTQDWFRKRVAWQAVSDFMMNPGRTAESVNTGKDWLLEFFFGLPPRQRTIRGLWLPCETAAQFNHQLGSLYLAVAGALNGFAGLESDVRPAG
jgi:glycosyltransferase involved in cell wall biosynthesis